MKLPSPAPITAIQGVWRFHKEAGCRIHSVSTPGHLLHYVIRGAYRLVMSGRTYDVRAGDILYYYETEPVEWFGGTTKVSFYSISFLAPALPPLPFDLRVIKATPGQQLFFKEIFKESNRGDLPASLFRMHAMLSNLWASLETLREKSKENGVESDDWWRIEARLRATRNYQASIDDLIRLSSKSYATLQRLCLSHFNMPPIKRVRTIRLEEAKGLLRYSDQPVTAIAEQLGYADVSEFSREFKKCEGVSPRAWRTSAGV